MPDRSRQSPHTSFVELLQERAGSHPERLVFSFLQDGETESARLNYGELDKRARAIAAHLQQRGHQGGRALLLYNPGLEFVAGFFGCLYANVTAVPAYPPRSNQLLSRLAAIVQDAETEIALTSDALLESIAERLKDLGGAAPRELIATDTLGDEEANAWQAEPIDPEGLAFLQYTSGSTGHPKGVMVSHANLLHNSYLINLCFEDSPGSLGACWLPPYHDMGLVGGVLQPIYVGASMILMPPVSFLQRPIRWLEAISRHGVTTSGGPNFAYEYCARQIRPEQLTTLDLSRWSLAFTGAEPVRAETIDQFCATFGPCGFRREAFFPCYGLAENTLIVTGGQKSQPPLIRQFAASSLNDHRVVALEGSGTGFQADSRSSRSLVSSGPVVGDQRLVVVDPEREQLLEPGQIGEIWVSGPSVAMGYRNQDDLSTATFRARLPDDPHPYLRTGDLGFLQDGELFVTGRRKDLIIIRGRNHYPQDIEATVASADKALRTGFGGAFSVEEGGEERLVVVQEVERSALRRLNAEALTEAIRAAVVEAHQLVPEAILLLKTGTIPKTSSGKIQRFACRKGYLEANLDVVGEWRNPSSAQIPPPPTAAEDNTAPPKPSSLPPAATSSHERQVHGWFTRYLGEKMGLRAEDVDVHRPLSHYGLDSMAAVRLTADLEDWLAATFPDQARLSLSPTLAYDYPTIALIAAALFQAETAGSNDSLAATSSSAKGQRELRDDDIAVVGMACRLPGATSPEALWDLLREGGSGVRSAQAAAITDRGFGRPPAAWAGYLESIDGFDAAFFGISPREAEQMDPQQRLLLESTWEAFEHAGIPPDRWAGSSAGVFVGISSNDYGQLKGAASVYWGTGNAHSIAANRLSYQLDLRGPSLAVDTACSSSLVAVHQDMGSLQRGECSQAIAAGVNLLLAPALTDTFQQAGMLAADGRCKTFDADADGYVRAEGCGVVLLKRLADARRDGDKVWGVICGSALNQDGRSNGLTAPSGLAQQSVVREALERSGVAASDVSYVEAHGTGTSLGDPIEVNALCRVLGRGRQADQTCWVGSLKANLGHLEAAAGIAGLIKVLLCMEHGALPPHPHLRSLNPLIDLEGKPFAINTALQAWQGAYRFAGVSSFGFGGTNAHLIVAAPPANKPPEAPASQDRPEHLLTLSAQSPGALKELQMRYAALLSSSTPPLDLADLCYSANLGRSHLPHRATWVGSDALDLEDALGNNRLPTGQVTSTPTLAFLFTGQGSQYPGMGGELLATQPVFREVINDCDHLLRSLQVLPEGWTLRRIMDHRPESNPTEPALSAMLEQTGITQPVLFSLEVALARLWMSWGVLPDWLLGHSVGEVAAACIAGVFDLDDGLRLIADRSRLMEALPAGGGMLALFTDAATVEALLAEQTSALVIAADNGPGNVVIAGSLEAIAALEPTLSARGIGAKRLRVSHAFHSPLMEPMQAEFRKLAAAIRYREPQIPIISNITHAPIGAAMADPEYWCRHICAPVRYGRGLQALSSQGVQGYLEIGPKPTLIEMARSGGVDPQASWLPSLRPGRSDTHQMLESLAALHRLGTPIDWAGFDGPFQRRRLPLPTTPWQHTRYWLPAAPTLPETAALSAAPRIASGPALPELFHSDWRPLPLPASLPSVETVGGQWLFIGPRPIYERFLQALPAGQICCWIEEHSHFQEVHPRHWQLDPCKPEHWLQLFDALADTPSLLGILQVVAQEGDNDSPLSLHRSLLQPLLAQTLLKREWHPQPPPRLWWLSTPARGDGSDLTSRMEEGQIQGFARCLALEHPDLWGGWLEFPTLDSAATMAQLLAELTEAWRNRAAARPMEMQVRFQSGQRQVCRLERLQPQEGVHASPCRLDGHVLISGGLGALGLETAAWLLAQGVPSLILVGRQPPTAQAEAQLLSWRQQGARIQVLQADIAEPAVVAQLSEAITSSGLPLRGIVHAAGVLEDAALNGVEASAWERVQRPKVWGAWHLHRLSQAHPVDVFILYSSLAALLGSPGQSAYGAANAALDALARQRRAQGLPAISLNWGPWSGSGMAERALMRSGRSLQAYGIEPLPASAYLQVLAPLFRAEPTPAGGQLAPPPAVVGVACLQMDTLQRAMAGRPQEAFLALLSESSVGSDHPHGAALQAQLRATAPGARAERLLLYLQTTLAGLLGLKAEQIGPDLHLLETGADSLMVMDALTQIQKDLGLMIYPRELYAHPRIGSLATYLAEVFTARDGGVMPSPSKTTTLELPAALRFRSSTSRKRSSPGAPKLPPALFVLSSPRAGSTLLRVMLAGHPQLFSPPELHLLPFASMAERKQALADSHLGEGLERALMELAGLDASQSKALLQSWEGEDLPIARVYAQLQSLAGERMLVDKSPTYALDLETLREAEELFEEAKFIHLVRHPYAVIRSFVDLRMEQLFGVAQGDPYQLAEVVWRDSNRNVLALEQEIGPERVHRIAYEDLVSQPEAILQRLCTFLGLPFHRALLAPYEGKRLTDGLHRQSLSVGDPNFSKHQAIDASLAVSWQTANLPRPLEAETVRLAESLGYSLPAPTASPSPAQPARSGWRDPQRREEVLDLQGLRLSRCEWGPSDGPAILCWHGVLDQGLIWEPVAVPLAEAGFRVIAPDLRGHGRSDHVGAGGSYQILDFITDAVGLTDQLVDRPLLLIGHSLGSIVASGLASLRASLVTQLILIEPILPAPPSQTNPREAINTMVDYALAPPRHTPMPSLGAASERLRRALPALPAGFAERLAERATKPEGDGLIWRWDPMLQTRMSLTMQGGPLNREAYLQLLSDLVCPITLIQGDTSGFNRPEDQEALQAALPRAHKRLLAGGHNLLVDVPEELSAAVLEAVNCAPKL
ncbi:MAG: alpha/beta fold hydrolase [Cyanobacteriota bacterium]